MNEFLQQFLVESREYVEQATDGLLILEKSPADTERLDEVFRAFHTLKGGAAIVEFPAMESAVHEAETVLGEARSGARPLTSASIGRCLACLDQVVAWLDTIDRTERVPSGAEAQADLSNRHFDSSRGVDSEPAGPPALERDWFAEITARHPAVAARALTAMRFVPDHDAFYRGEDPFALVASLPRLLALDLQPASDWPPLESFDPFACNLVLTALTASAAAEVAAHMHGHSGTCDVRALGQQAPRRALAGSTRATDVLDAQVALLRHGHSAQPPGKLASAGATAANVLRAIGMDAEAQAIARATERSLAERSPQALLDALARVLNFETAGAVATTEPPQPGHAPSRTLRIDANRIDDLVRLTGELTVAKNAFGHVAQLAQADGNPLAGMLKDRHGVLEHLVGELQRSVLELRVLPLRTVLQRFPRLVREMSANLGKPMQLVIQGEETEADKAIVEMLFEPMLHVIRNAADHGIEGADERARLGKPAVATIAIRAMREGNEVLIDVVDDGRGIDVERVREVARMRRHAGDESLRTMTDAALIDLVFTPGFSTVADVTALSGRGVGMDSVRTAVARFGGRVGLESRPGVGTTVRFALPYSVMMTHVVTVEAGGQSFGIPLEAVVETLRIPRARIARVGAAQAIAHGGRTIPIVELATTLGGEARQLDTEAEALIVVAAVGEHACGIRVDRLGERLQVMLKPLEGLLSDTPGISGTTMLGDGRVLLVLDVAELLS